MAVVKKGNIYYVVVHYKSDNGKRRPPKWIRIGPSHSEAVARNDKIKDQLRERRLNLSRKYIVKDYLNEWLEEKIKPHRRPNTYTNYKDLLQPVIAHYGSLKLEKFDSSMVQRHINEQLSRGLAPTSVSTGYSILKKALSVAVAAGYITVNPCNKDALTVPGKNEPKQTPLTPDQGFTLEAITLGTELGLPVVLGLREALRNGEICGLRWSDINLETKEATIKHSLDRMPKEEAERRKRHRDPKERIVWYGCETKGGNVLALGPVKTKGSSATIPLSDVVIEHLVGEKESQEQNASTYGKAYNNIGFVWAREDGLPHAPDNYYKHLRKAISKFNKAMKKDEDKLPLVKVHDLRHSCATFLLRLRVDIKLVSAILRHKNASFTMDTYQHVQTDMVQEPIRQLDEVIKPK